MADALTLEGSGAPLDLGRGFALLAPGLRGEVRVHERRLAGTRGPEAATPELDAALADAGITEVRAVELDVRRTPPPAAAARMRSADGQDALMLEVPDFGPETGQVVLAIDEGGVMTWHYAVEDAEAVGASVAGTRGAGARKRFLIRRHVAVTPAAIPGGGAAPEKRGLAGVVGRKILKVLVYKAVDAALGEVAEHFVGRWEGKRRAHRVRQVTPDSLASTGAPGVEETQWRALAAGPALLFVHGTFSTTHAAFGQLPRATVEELAHRYGGRLFAFDHPSLSAGPADNARWLLGQVPPGLPLQLDIVCHSRGGLVTRCLAERPDGLGALAPQLRVRRVVFVGAPNAGTLLAHPDRVPAMLDRMTTMLNLDPIGIVGDVLDALLTVVKVVGRAGLVHLDGLASMNPEGEFLRRLNAQAAAGAGSTEYFAIASDYSAAPGALLDYLKDGAMDRIFRDAGNDLVVPSLGVHAANGSARFPIAPARTHLYTGSSRVTHGGYFAHPETSRRLLAWLA